MKLLINAGAPVGVLVAPVIPALNDHEIPSVLAAAKAAGAGWAGTEIVRLPLAVAPIFQEWLDRNVPEKKGKVLGRVFATRGARPSDPRFRARMSSEGIFTMQIPQMFRLARRKPAPARRWTKVVNRGLQEAGGRATRARPLGSLVGLRWEHSCCTRQASPRCPAGANAALGPTDDTPNSSQHRQGRLGVEAKTGCGDQAMMCLFRLMSEPMPDQFLGAPLLPFLRACSS